MDRVLFNAYGNFYYKDNIFSSNEPIFHELKENVGEKFKYKIPSNK